jgi:hypothetical protein
MPKTRHYYKNRIVKNKYTNREAYYALHDFLFVVPLIHDS